MDFLRWCVSEPANVEILDSWDQMLKTGGYEKILKNNYLLLFSGGYIAIIPMEGLSLRDIDNQTAFSDRRKCTFSLFRYCVIT